MIGGSARFVSDSPVFGLSDPIRGFLIFLSDLLRLPVSAPG
jgi:hypothetical protein